MIAPLAHFAQIVVYDTEFHAPPGAVPAPICLVATEVRSGKQWRLWKDDLQRTSRPPFPTGDKTLCVGFYTVAEMSCHLALGWPTPTHIVDLYAEFRCLTNGHKLIRGRSLVGALSFFGIATSSLVAKESMRELAINNTDWTPQQREDLLNYCEADVQATLKLWQAMQPYLDLRYALLRGRYTAAVARMEHIGIPVDADTLGRVRAHRTSLKEQLIDRLDAEYGVYKDGHFNLSRFEAWLIGHGIGWPRTPSGRLATDDQTFKRMAAIHPAVVPLRELRQALALLRAEKLAVGPDGRNRCMLSPFSSRTGRNQPSNARFIFGQPAWLRGLIQPTIGWALAYQDWAQQEFAIAGAISKDKNMLAAYNSGDPYLAFAKQAGAVPEDGTAETHPQERAQFKQCVLAVQYGMGPDSLAARLGEPVERARQLLQRHRETYPTFWRWSDAVVDHAMLTNKLHTTFNWKLQVATRGNERPNSRSLRNFPMQANGAEMLRLACCLATERGIRVCAPVHDAILIEAPIDEIDNAVATTSEAMAEASATILGGLRLRTDSKIIRHPERFIEKRGSHMWNLVNELLPP